MKPLIERLAIVFARLGYLGIAYSALLKAGFGPGKTLLIGGITGTLGVGAALVALAMGATWGGGVGRASTLSAATVLCCSQRWTKGNPHHGVMRLRAQMTRCQPRRFYSTGPPAGNDHWLLNGF